MMNFAEVEKLVFKKQNNPHNDSRNQTNGAVGGEMYTLTLHLIVDGARYTDFVPDAEFALNNPALQVLAYLGHKPSDFDGQTLECDGDLVPVVATGRNDYSLQDRVLQEGKQKLGSCDWSPVVDIEGSNGSAGSSTDGSSDDNDGDGPDEDLTIENNPNERGLNVEVR